MKILTIVLLAVTLMFGAVDINSASKKGLSSLHGIGSKKADKIIYYRDTHCFKSVDELALVNGIGKKTVEKNRDNMTVGKCKTK